MEYEDFMTNDCMGCQYGGSSICKKCPHFNLITSTFFHSYSVYGDYKEKGKYSYYETIMPSRRSHR